MTTLCEYDCGGSGGFSEATAEVSTVVAENAYQSLPIGFDGDTSQYFQDDALSQLLADADPIGQRYTNYVGVQVRDGARNVKGALDTIMLDTTRPEVDVQINGGADLTNARHIVVSLDAYDAHTEVVEMRFAINGWSEEKFSEWEPFVATKTLTLPNWQGTNYVGVQVRDAAGNVRGALDSIVLDTIAPKGTVAINGGAEVTTSRQVTLDLSASDNLSGVAEMRFAVNRTDDASFSVWEPFATTKTLILPKWQGTNYVNVQLRDEAGNIRRWIWDSIVLDLSQAAVVTDVTPLTSTTSAAVQSESAARGTPESTRLESGEHRIAPGRAAITAETAAEASDVRSSHPTRIVPERIVTTDRFFTVLGLRNWAVR